MRKYLVALLSVMMILAFTVSSDARHEVKDQFEYTPQIVKSKKAMIELGGYIRVRGEVSDNNTDMRDTESDTTTTGACATASGDVSNHCRDDEAVWNQKVKLSLKATVSPNTMGFIELESGSGDNSDTWTWGTTTEGASGIYQVSNSKRGALYIRQAYIAHQTNALGIPSGFKVGHMLLALGNGIFFDHSKFGDDAILFWLSPADAIEISLIAIKLAENGAIISDDADAYVVAVEGGAGPVNFSADVTLVRDNDFANGGAIGSNDGDANLNATLWNIGLRADADVGPVNIYGDVELQTGVIEDFRTAANAGDDMDLSGWALLVGAEANVGPVTIHGEFAYGSGDDRDTEDEYEGFINSIGSGQHYTYLYDQHVTTAGQTAGALVAARGTSGSTATSSTYIGNTANNTGLANTTYVNVGASAKAGPDIKVSGDLYFLWASESVAADSSTANAETTEDQDIGVELDAKVTYQVDTNLVYYVEAGYLWAGDFYTNVTRDSGNIDNPWSVRNGMVFSF